MKTKNKMLVIAISGGLMALLVTYAVLHDVSRDGASDFGSARATNLQAAAGTGEAKPRSQIDAILALAPASPERRTDSRLVEEFRAAQSCYFLRSELESIKKQLVDCESLDGISGVEDRYKECSALKPNQEAQRIQLERQAASCPDDSKKLEQDYIRSVDVAASHGDADAQMCFMHLTDQGENLRSDSGARVTQYAKAAFARGDWRIVDFVHGSALNSRNAIAQIFGNDFATRYRMNRLLRKGAIGNYANELDQLARAALAAKGEDGQSILTPSEVTNAEEWADQAFAKYFKNSLSLDSAPVLCAGSDGAQ